MSYILDALKKAAEQRGVATTALLRSSVPAARGVRMRRLPWLVLGGLVALNVGGLIYVLRPAPVSVPPVTQEREAPPRPVTVIRDVARPTPSPTQVIEPTPPRRSAPVKTSAVKPPELAVARPAPAPRPVVAPPPTAAAPPAAPTPVAPPATARSTTSKLKLEVLSYSEVPAQRLVFISGHRYREGDTVEGGAKVEEIREDGVVLSDQGQRFTLR
jgi:Type II secretion system protein B